MGKMQYRLVRGGEKVPLGGQAWAAWIYLFSHPAWTKESI